MRHIRTLIVAAAAGAVGIAGSMALATSQTTPPATAPKHAPAGPGGFYPASNPVSNLPLLGQTYRQAIEHGLHSEGLPGVTWPANWAALSPSEQLFVAMNLERVARGLTPFLGIAGALNPPAAQAAQASRDGIPHDPSLPKDFRTFAML